MSEGGLKRDQDVIVLVEWRVDFGSAGAISGEWRSADNPEAENLIP
jgi:hypothetical protein